MQYTIQNSKLCVVVDSYGAQIKSVKYSGKERAWQNENGAWKDTAPLLFPVCGHFGVTVDGKSYPISAHGFAKKAEFALVSQTENTLIMQTCANAQTKAVYPFDFIFTVTYTVENDTLRIEYAVENTGEKPLYFACGGHDSFTFTGEIDGYQLAFERKENLVHYFHDDDGYLTGETQNYGENPQTLVLPSDFLQEGRTLIFKGINSRKVRLETRDQKPLADISFDGFDNLLIWRATADSNYVCIEPWTNLPDQANLPDIEFSQKQGTYKVVAHARKSLVREIKYYD